MEIVVRGEFKPNCYEGTCSKCKSVIRYNDDEIEEVGHQLNNHKQSVSKCPVCESEKIIIRSYITQDKSNMVCARIELGDYENIKNGKSYSVIAYATNATNAQDGDSMVIYTLTEMVHNPARILYVRNSEEFFQKFKKF